MCTHTHVRTYVRTLWTFPEDSETSVENRELAASVAKKQSELRMAEVRRGTK